MTAPISADAIIDFATEYCRRKRLSFAEEVSYEEAKAMHAADDAWLVDRLDEFDRVWPLVGRIDLSELGVAEAAFTVFRVLARLLPEIGMSPSWELQLLPPEIAKDHYFEGGEGYWIVGWEAGPHGWAIDFSCGEPLRDTYGRRVTHPVLTCQTGASDWYLDAGYSFTLLFVDERETA